MHDFDHGLAADLATLRTQARRRQLLLGLLGGAAGIGTAQAQPRATTGNAACRVLPSETAGPFPGNGTNRVNGALASALALSGIERSDIRASIAGAAGIAAGVPLTLTLQLLNAGGGCSPLADHAIYLWQCDREGRYSMYSPGAQDQNYLRGVQRTAADGSASFTTIVPGCYPGRVPHLHFEVYRRIGAASAAALRLKTSQIALPLAQCEQVYRQADGYADSLPHLAGLSFASDGVFSDSVAAQLATLSGSPAAGYTARLTVGLAG
ncbi:intradiol ring-cleavage dioxygenase [Aquabacterium sp.]|uniref:dioxygenase family protein n=1 Tax=Aquabacterium sp. TaxID=1872578 RepID=UPI002CD99917|nr:intradiol ring-cleavage dioxygenase [Aquabacterium sp.]HSW04373.1 intradiol ring-cleavage dioxygenase [Aquabacterium sp.]